MEFPRYKIQLIIVKEILFMAYQARNLVDINSYTRKSLHQEVTNGARVCGVIKNGQ